MRKNSGFQEPQGLPQICLREKILVTLRQTPEFRDVCGTHLLQFIADVPIETTLEDQTIGNLKNMLLLGLQGLFWEELVKKLSVGSGTKPDLPDERIATRFLGNSGVFNLNSVLEKDNDLEPFTSGGRFEVIRRVRVRGPARFVRIDENRVSELLAKSDTFRRAIQERNAGKPRPTPEKQSSRDERGRPAPKLRISTLDTSTPAAPPRAQTIAFESTFEGIQIPPLLKHLATRIGADFNKRVLLFDTGAEATPKQLAPNVQRAAGTDSSKFQGDFDYIFVPRNRTIVAGNGPQGAQDSVVSLTGRLPEPSNWRGAAGTATEQLDTVLLRSLDAPSGGSLVMMPDAFASQGNGRYSACWLDLGRSDLEFLAANETLAAASTAQARRLDDALGRWARAVTHRRVGVALSGGGVWGFRHVAVLRMLHELGVPIDMVSGASMGAVVAAYYGARGLEGLDALVELTQGRLLRLVQVAGALSPLPLQRLLERDLGQRALHQLTTRCLPVATELTEGLSQLVFNGGMAEAIAMCASPPGLTPSVPVRTQRYVDGAIMNNLPASVLATFGADFTLAINSYPLARQGEGRPSSNPLEVFLKGLNPVRRFWDLLFSGNLMLYVNGMHQGLVANRFIDDSQGLNDSPRQEPLSQAMDFSRAPAIIEQAMKSDLLRLQVENFAEDWFALQAPSPPSSLLPGMGMPFARTGLGHPGTGAPALHP